MRYVFLVLVFCIAYPLIGQENNQLPFNQKSYPEFYANDSLVFVPKNHLGTKPKLEQNNNQSRTIAKKEGWNMPIIKPESNSSTPVFPVDSTQTYFLRVYPYSKG